MTPAFPLIGMGTGNEGGINLSSFLPQSFVPPSSNPQQSNNPFDISGPLKKASGAVGKVFDAATKNSFLGLLFGSDYQYLTGIIGLLLIVAGIFLFRPVRETVITAAKTGAKVAAAA